VNCVDQHECNSVIVKKPKLVMACFTDALVRREKMSVLLLLE
jgi:hypothetical protein